MEARALTMLLGDTWFGAALPGGARARLAAVGRVVHYPGDAIVITEGRPCDAMGIVVDGRIALRLGVPGTPNRTILTVEPGDVFGWSAVLDSPIATLTCVTTEPTQAVVFDREGLRAALDVDNELAAAVYRRLLGSVTRRLSATRLQLLDVYRTAEPW
jgi:CRP-like cAMP-binding protein